MIIPRRRSKLGIAVVPTYDEGTDHRYVYRLSISDTYVSLFGLVNNILQIRNDVYPAQFLFSVPDSAIAPFSWSPYKTSLDPSRRGTVEITRQHETLIVIRH